nr:RNA-directed DNA polymerase, eukaryota, reverse transcriptase zinc-binding domain protein [Tanacetum cinerariifolium]
MNEGFVDIKIQYTGELWVLLEFPSTKSKELFHENVGLGSWFSVLRQASSDFTPEGRIVWVNIEGRDVFSLEKVVSLYEVWTLDLRMVTLKFKTWVVVEMIVMWHRYQKRCLRSLRDRKRSNRRTCLNVRSVNDDNPQNYNVVEVQTGQEGNSANKGSKVDVSELVCSGHFKKSEASRTGGSILCLLEELVKVGQTMGYNMDGCVNNMAEIIESQGASWDGEVVTICDFNEVRYKSDRFGLVFNVQGADVFNSFIANAGLEEVPLGRNTWSEAPGDDSNSMRSMMRKLKYLKVKTREWNNGNRNNTKRAIEKYKEELEALDAAIDKGNGSDDIVNKRMEVIKSMHHIDKILAMVMAQKAKIKWSIEGDENSRFFHGMLNKKRSQLNIRGIMVDGVWTEKPNTVKHEFLQHLRRRFLKPTVSRAYVNMSYPKSITIDQQMDLERDVSKEELKRAVWDCETDKPLAVKHFFTYGDIPKGCNSSFIALIPKIPDANLVKDFRPISRIGSIYKIIAKILANRLVGVLGDIVNELSPSLNLSHMFYANDAVFVGQWCDEDEKVKYASSKLGCLILNTPLSYLGTKVGGSMSWVQAWKEVVDKVKSRLSNWKMKALSIGGRLTLLKSVLGSMPIFHMSIFRVPLSVLRMLESIRSHFFNGHKLRSNKATWVKWNIVLASKEKGGLGVSSLYALNRGLMLKWVWRFYSQKTSLWAKVIKAIYGDDGKVGKVTNAGIRSCWMNIVNEISVLKNQGVNVFDFMRIKLGNGDTTAFWEDNWIGGNVLKYLYPRIYALETCKSVTVSKNLTDSSLDNSFRCKTRGGVEQVQYNALSDLVHAVTLVPLSDRWVWSLESSGEFSVDSVRKVIDEKRLSNVNTMTRWIKCVPIKVNVLAWKIKIVALPTRLNISRRGIDIDSILCPICDCGVKSSSHLFFSCSLARQVARKISLWRDVTYVDVNFYVEWVTWMISLRLTSKLKLMLEGVFYVMWWYLWSYRKKLLFETKAPLKAVIFYDVVSSSYYWCRYRCKASFSWDLGRLTQKP